MIKLVDNNNIIIKLLPKWVCLWSLFIGMALELQGEATNRYVATNAPSPGYPYDSWDNAGTNIIDVVNVANANNAGDMVIVSNGVYYLTNQISVTNTVVTNFTGDRTKVIIDGNYPNTINRCFYLNHANAVVSGFTITNGYVSDSGGGVKMEDGTVHNCIIVGNINATSSGALAGGGLYVYPNGLVRDCTITGNSVSNSGGGGIFLRSNGTIRDSLIFNNYAKSGGGVELREGGLATNCVVSNNTAAGVVQGNGGGGVFFDSGGLLVDSTICNNTSFNFGGGLCFIGSATGTGLLCTITANSGGKGGGASLYQNSGRLELCIIQNNIGTNQGAGAHLNWGGILKNCLICSNFTTLAGANGGGIFASRMGVYAGYIESCTIASNYATRAGGYYSSDTNNPTTNCIIYGNTSDTIADYDMYFVNAVTTNDFKHCSSSYVLPASQGNITNDPQFVSESSGNYRLTVNSPCINTGTNLNWMTDAVDLDNRPRLDKFRWQVDMGAYEHMFSGMIIRVR